MADLTITAANVVVVSGAVKRTENASATITAGQAVYLNSNTEWALCDADVQSTANCNGIALHASLNNQPLTVMSGGVINLGATLAVGEVYAVSTTAGGIAPVADLASGDFVTVLGVALTAANLELKIQNSATAEA
jgi:hypothetical protein